jgi:uncharacterized repeat protein (TIGR01451 family)
MKKWIIPVMVAIVILLMPASAQVTGAQDVTGLSLSKSVDPTMATVGDTITYTYNIINTDNSTINSVSLEDDLLGPIDLGGQTSLGPGANITATATYTVVEADLPGPLVNTATVSGNENGNTVTASATATVELSYSASLQLTKVANPTSVAVGDSIEYTYTITNDGSVAVDNVTLEDDLLGSIELGGETTLGAGATITVSANYTVVESDLPGPLVNTATVSGKDLEGNTITANASSTVDLTSTASLQVTKSADRDSATPHQTINYTYNVTNNGNVTIDGLSLEDNMLGTIPLSVDTLAPSQSTTATASYTVTISDLPGPIVNTATSSGTASDKQSISATSEAVSVSLSQNIWEWFKYEILKWRGVPGKGIEHAPGLQKPFNPKSQAAEHAGKKDKSNVPEQIQTNNRVENQGTEEQLRIRERTENQENQGAGEQLQVRGEIQNQGTEGQFQTTLEVQNQSSDGHGTQANHGNGQLKKNDNTDNQTGGQGATSNGYKPDKDKPNGNSKSGK